MEASVPTIKEIQQILVDIGDKKPSTVGSSEWIGSFEVSYVIDEKLKIECQIVHVASGDELNKQARGLISHFLNYGAPVMIGGDKFAYCIGGLRYNRSSGEAEYLIIDPHYPGEDSESKVLTKGWVDWKATDKIFKKGAFYNLCIPQLPKKEL